MRDFSKPKPLPRYRRRGRPSPIALALVFLAGICCGYLVVIGIIHATTPTEKTHDKFPPALPLTPSVVTVEPEPPVTLLDHMTEGRWN